MHEERQLIHEEDNYIHEERQLYARGNNCILIHLYFFTGFCINTETFKGLKLFKYQGTTKTIR